MTSMGLYSNGCGIFSHKNKALNPINLAAVSFSHMN